MSAIAAHAEQASGRTGLLKEILPLYEPERASGPAPAPPGAAKR